MTHIRSATRSAAAASLAVAATIALAAAPADARLIESETFHDEFSFEDTDFCGTGRTVTFDQVVDGRFMVRTQGRAGLAYFANHITVTELATDVATGQTTTRVERVLDKDLHVTDQGDTLLIEILATGASSVYGEDGKAIARNPGQVRFELVVDHNGTPEFPDDDTEISFTQVRESTGRTDDYCAAILEYWGIAP
jgi:hypothetical protein